MDSDHTYRRPGAFSPVPSTSLGQSQPLKELDHQEVGPSDSESSQSSQSTAMSTNKRLPFKQMPSPARPSSNVPSNFNSSTPSLLNYPRPSITQIPSDQPSRKNSPLNPVTESQRHKRQYSQGFFEPSLSTASLAEQSTMSNLTASQIAAQAAMQQQSNQQHIRKRSLTVPSPQSPPENGNQRSKASSLQPIHVPNNVRKLSSGSLGIQQYHNGHNIAATSAANAAFPRNAQLSPGLTNFEPATVGEQKVKSEKSKMKLFSKPKHIGISSHKDSDRKDKSLPSANRIMSPGPSSMYKAMNASTTSLAESSVSGTPSLYSTNNASTSTLVPSDRAKTDEKEKGHKHHFLSRQKHKLKDKMDEHPLTLSSASSNSRPLDPNAPQSIYSFAPVSPGPSSTSFSKSMSGLDLRHGGRALREKKKEEKAAMPILESKRVDVDRTDWALSSSFGANHSLLGSASASNVSIVGSGPGSTNDNLAYGNIQGFGISNMTPEDAWDFLKAKLLIIFEGEELRMPVEDLNRLVLIHIERCVKNRAPGIITEDLQDLLKTGFLSLEQTLRGVPDEQLVPYLVEMWLFVFGTVLPYMQSVFFPLDLEFAGNGTLMTPRQAAEFWGFVPDSIQGFDNELDVRRIVLLSYRDTIILPRHDILKAIFSRLSLENINVSVSRDSPAPMASPRPGTSGSLDPGISSFNSQGSTLLDDSTGARSRATSNTSAPELPSFAPGMTVRRSIEERARQVPPDSAKVTETVGRMLQCVSVLASVQSGDDAQSKMEELARELKLNWLGRGRTGRNRKGFVGTRMPATVRGQGNRVGSVL